MVAFPRALKLSDDFIMNSCSKYPQTPPTYRKMVVLSNIIIDRTRTMGCFRLALKIDQVVTMNNMAKSDNHRQV